MPSVSPSSVSSCLQASSEGRPGEGTSLLKVARGSGGHAAPELRSARLSTDGPLPDHPLRSAGLEMILVTQRIVPGGPAAMRFTGHTPHPVPGAVWRPGLALSPLITPSMTWEAGAVSAPTLQTRTWGRREAKPLLKGHSAGRWGLWDCSLDLENENGISPSYCSESRRVPRKVQCDFGQRSSPPPLPPVHLHLQKPSMKPPD